MQCPFLVTPELRQGSKEDTWHVVAGTALIHDHRCMLPKRISRSYVANSDVHVVAHLTFARIRSSSDESDDLDWAFWGLLVVVAVALLCRVASRSSAARAACLGPSSRFCLLLWQRFRSAT